MQGAVMHAASKIAIERLRFERGTLLGKRRLFSGVRSTYRRFEATQHALNPLQRLEDLGTRRFGVIFEFEGVVVPCRPQSELEDWHQLAHEEKLIVPAQYQLRSAFRRKTSHVVSRVFNWGTEPQRVKYLTRRKSELFCNRVRRSGKVSHSVRSFFQLLNSFHIPCAIYSSQLTTEELDDLLILLELKDYFKGESGSNSVKSVVLGSDFVQSGLPDTEYYLLAADALSRSTQKCVVISDHHLAIEATLELGMKCIIVNGDELRWELRNADMVVPSLESISFRNLQNTFSSDVYDN